MPRRTNTGAPAFSPRLMRKMGNEAYEKELGAVVARSEKAKRTLSNVSRTTNEAIRKAPALKQFCKNSVALEAFIANEVRKKVDAVGRVVQADINVANEHVRVFNVLYNSQEFAMTSNEARGNRDVWETRVLKGQFKLAVLQGQRHQLIGKYIDDMEALPDGQHKNDWFYFEFLMSRYHKPKHATLALFKPPNLATESRFTKRVVRAYGTRCILKCKWHYSCAPVAAHIVPNNIGEANAQYLFGKPKSKRNGHLMSAHNGIPLCEQCVEYLEDGYLTLVPIPGTSDIKVVVFSQLKPIEPQRGYAGQEFHGKILRFENEFRPDHRYLYFHYTTTLLQHQRSEPPGWWKNFTAYGLHDIWARPGRYLRQSSMLALAQTIGHLSPEEAAFFMNPKGKDAAEFEHGNDDGKREHALVTAISMRPGTGFHSHFCWKHREPLQIREVRNKSPRFQYGRYLDENESGDEEESTEEDEDEEEEQFEDESEDDEEDEEDGDDQDDNT
ncbi:hypothetical protein B0T10DRAFT_564042 [Thelonectria olida]|uniref:HNH nuclease domain-containing protein n=1 Tax=Thelonectria olida TaxID=1576542 RepID=A0A9P8VZ49_9HYPO|nr:hypothetical protein B0T10DRAFT_564042 [Thelonectria olida]